MQWDLVLKHLSVKGVSDSELKTDSTDWGNYYNKTYEITNTSAKYSTNYGASFTNAPYNKTASAEVLLTTGAHDNFSKYNIYDLAGNVVEWRLENTYGVSDPCSCRGGGCGNEGSYYPVSTRSAGRPASSNNAFGFRCSLY